MTTATGPKISSRATVIVHGGVGEHGRLQEEARPQRFWQVRYTAPCGEPGALGDAGVDELAHLVPLPRADERSHLGVGQGRVTDSDGRGAGRQGGDERVVVGPLHQES